MESDQLGTEEVVSWSKAGWEIEVPPSLVADESVDGPLATVQPLMGDLEPLQSGLGGCGGVANLSTMCR